MLGDGICLTACHFQNGSKVLEYQSVQCTQDDCLCPGKAVETWSEVGTSCFDFVAGTGTVKDPEAPWLAPPKCACTLNAPSAQNFWWVESLTRCSLPKFPQPADALYLIASISNLLKMSARKGSKPLEGTIQPLTAEEQLVFDALKRLGKVTLPPPSRAMTVAIVYVEPPPLESRPR